MAGSIAYKYENISLVPKYSRLISRSEASTAVTLGTKTFKVPIIPANMKSVLNQRMAKWLSENDYMYIMHRFGVDNFHFVSRANKENWKNISISIGVRIDDLEFVIKAKEKGLRIDYITIDIAHGHCVFMKNTLAHLKENLRDTYIIAGNVATRKAVEDLHAWGADCVKVGIGQGNVCTTKDKTGFTYPMFTCTQNCNVPDIPIIADGGIKCNGDIAKAIVAGGHMVMAGSLFSACTDSPGEKVTLKGGRIGKKYFGSASEKNKGHKRHIEGVEKVIECNYMTYAEKLDEIEQDLQSSISYAGGAKLDSLKNAEYIINY